MLTSIIRTLVPVIVGALLTVPVVARLNITEADLTTAVTALVTGVYYLAVRLAEQRWPDAGLLLGSRRQPSYPDVQAAAKKG